MEHPGQKNTCEPCNDENCKICANKFDECNECKDEFGKDDNSNGKCTKCKPHCITELDCRKTCAKCSDDH